MLPIQGGSVPCRAVPPQNVPCQDFSCRALLKRSVPQRTRAVPRQTVPFPAVPCQHQTIPNRAELKPCQTVPCQSQTVPNRAEFKTCRTVPCRKANRAKPCQAQTVPRPKRAKPHLTIKLSQRQSCATEWAGGQALGGKCWVSGVGGQAPRPALSTFLQQLSLGLLAGWLAGAGLSSPKTAFRNSELAFYKTRVSKLIILGTRQSAF